MSPFVHTEINAFCLQDGERKLNQKNTHIQNAAWNW